MGIVLKFPLAPIDIDRVRTEGGEGCEVIRLPVGWRKQPVGQPKFAQAFADLARAFALLAGDPPHNTG